MLTSLFFTEAQAKGGAVVPGKEDETQGSPTDAAFQLNGPPQGPQLLGTVLEEVGNSKTGHTTGGICHSVGTRTQPLDLILGYLETRRVIDSGEKTWL